MGKDYSKLGITLATIKTGPTGIVGVPGRSMCIRAISETVLSGVVLTLPEPSSGVSDTAVTIPVGGEVLGVRSCTVDSGQCQIFFMS